MYNDTRTNQAGSIAIFLVVTVLLAFAVVGGSYLVQKRGVSARSQMPVLEGATSEQKPQEDSNKNSENSQSNTQAQQEAAKKAEEDRRKSEAAAAAEKKAQADKEAKQKAEQEATKQPPATSVPQTSTAPQSSEAQHLPTTGPTENFIAVIGASILLGAVVAYLKSYKFRFGSFFN